MLPVSLRLVSQTVPETQHFDIAIIGAGIAGSALAIALSGSGLSIALIEAQPLPESLPEAEPNVGGFDPRVSALTPNSRSLLDRLGAWPDIEAARCAPYAHMTVWDAEGTAVVEFDCEEVSVPALGYIVENRVIVSALLARVRACRDVTLHNPARLAACARAESGRTRK